MRLAIDNIGKNNGVLLQKRRALCWSRQFLLFGVCCHLFISKGGSFMDYNIHV